MKRILVVLLAFSFSIVASGEGDKSFPGPQPGFLGNHETTLQARLTARELELTSESFFAQPSTTYEFSLESWPMEDFGFSFSIGQYTLDVNRPDLFAAAVVESPFGGPFLIVGASTVMGDVTFTPFGPNLIMQKNINKYVFVDVYTGVRYVLVQADVTESTAAVVVDEGIHVSADFSAHGSDGFLGLIGAEIGIILTKHLSVAVGVGYQFDIVSPELEFNSGELNFIQDADLEAFFANASIILTF